MADELRARGDEIANPVFGEVAPIAPADVVAEFVDAIPDGRDVVVVAHSNAGYYVPVLAAARQVAAAIFVDAALPPFETPRTRVAPARFLDFLGPKADADGLLPVWTEWWDEVSELFPDPDVQAAVEREQRRFPLTYFTQELAVPPGWTSVPCAYLAFGETYGEELGMARDRGWPVSTIAGGHLEMLMQPGRVADELHRLLAGVVSRGRQST